MSRPNPLQLGDLIMFVAPAGDLDEAKMMLAKSRLEKRGYRVKMRDDLFTQEGYLAGSDERRADELMEAFLDPEVKAIFPGTGGYGTMRILDLLDYKEIRKNPKIVIGFSDITGLHLALNGKAGLITYHTPSPMWGLGGQEGLSPFTKRYFFELLEGSSASVRRGYEIEISEGVPVPVCLGRGRARGRLVGGNLSLLSALEGTPYSVPTKDAILLIEDTREAPYRIDRMLRQLLLAGKLQQLRGAVLGQFTRNFSREDQSTEDPRFSVDGVLRQYFEPLDIPVIMNFPLGHHPMNASLPLGGKVEVDADRCTLRVLGSV
ncbi:MAG: LD-carboxypeptidase [Thermoanaerobaculia bacterium]